MTTKERKYYTELFLFFAKYQPTFNFETEILQIEDFRVSLNEKFKAFEVYENKSSIYRSNQLSDIKEFLVQELNG